MKVLKELYTKLIKKLAAKQIDKTWREGFNSGCKFWEETYRSDYWRDGFDACIEKFKKSKSVNWKKYILFDQEIDILKGYVGSVEDIFVEDENGNLVNGNNLIYIFDTEGNIIYEGYKVKEELKNEKVA